jgi:hypothetical protein
VTFQVSDAVFLDLRHVIGLIMRGYESRLVVPEAEPGTPQSRGK